ncbi:MAG TPA: glycosyltransferase family 2 protein [bacterium]|nr:glycosyltransferase family 2 protein [bacterium]
MAALLLNWRGAAMTLQCLGDLLRVDGVTLLVLVIDNGSGAAEVDRLRAGIDAADANGHAIELLALPDNLGFTGGMNRGLRLAAARAVPFALVLNNDLRLPADFLRPLVDVLRHDASVAAVGPTVVHPDGTVWAEGGAVAFAANALRLHGHGRSPRPPSHGPEEVGFVPGACLLLRTAAAAEIGFFADDYFMYWEDVDLGARLRRQGHKNIWLPWVQVEHHAGSSSGGGRSPLRKFLMACNAVRYLKACGGAQGWLGWFVFDVLLWPLAFARGPRAACAKLRGTVAGLCGHRASAADVIRYLG